MITHKLIGFFAYIVWDVWGNEVNCKFSAVRLTSLYEKTAEAIFLTKNGAGDLVVMDIETYNRREKMLKLREELLAIEEDSIAGRSGSSKKERDYNRYAFPFPDAAAFSFF